MLAPARSLLLCACLSLLGASGGCEFHVSKSHRSGSVDDEYVGEPLTDDVKRYEHALEVSNRFVVALKAEQFDTIREELCGKDLSKELGGLGLQKLVGTVVENYGPLLRYIPQQWGFTTGVQNGQRLLYSSKIVECERDKVRFVLVFHDDGKYERFEGIQWHPLASPAQAQKR